MLVGRAVKDKKLTVGEVRQFDIKLLIEKGVFEEGPGAFWTCTWRRREQVTASIGYKLVWEDLNRRPVALRFMYTFNNRYTGHEEDLDYHINLVTTACHFGGVRWWFRCPLAVGGIGCRRRCSVLYLPPNAKYLGCRECHDLTYESRQRHRDEFYEGFIKPYRKMEEADEKLMHTRSIRTTMKIIEEIERAKQIIDNYQRKFDLRMRTPLLRSRG